MGININAGIGRLLINNPGGGYKEYEGKALLMLGKQGTMVTYQEFYEICDKLEFTLLPFAKDWIREEDKKRTDYIDSYDLFKQMGFETVHCLDIIACEGCDILFDLQSENCPEELVQAYDVIYDGGTLEHIFNIPNALNNLDKMLRAGGIIIHDVALAGWIDHGYYSVSPVLFQDYYSAHHYRINDLFMFAYGGGREYGEMQLISPDCRIVDSNRWVCECAGERNVLVVCVATKLKKGRECKNDLIQINNDQEELENRHGQLSKIPKIRRLSQLLEEKVSEFPRPLAIYGLGATQEAIIAEFVRRGTGLEKEIRGLYDRDRGRTGETAEYYRCCLPVLDIDKIGDEGIGTLIIASVSWHTDEIYNRLKYLQEYGIKVVKLKEIEIDMREYIGIPENIK